MSKNRPTGPLPKLLVIVTLFFTAVLIGSYVIAKQANPVMLDEHGNVRP